MSVTCRECRHFQPDKIGDGSGLGRCLVFDAYLAKGPSPKAIRSALSDLGNRDGETLFWGGNLKTRNCKKYEANV